MGVVEEEGGEEHQPAVQGHGHEAKAEGGSGRHEHGPEGGYKHAPQPNPQGTGPLQEPVAGGTGRHCREPPNDSCQGKKS